MSELEIYGYIVSQPLLSVLAFCNLSGIPYTFHEFDYLKREDLTEEFAKINPYQQVPAIVHNGYNLWESAAIISYLADAYNIDNQWYPKDLKVRGRINSYLHWHHENIRNPITSYLRAKIYRPKYSGTPQLTAETEAPYIEKLNEFYSNLTWILSDTHYVARTVLPTIADIFACNECASGKEIPIDFRAHPVINAWYCGIEAIPEVKILVDAYFEAIKAF